MNRIPQASDLAHELTFSTSRSSGPGGQNVNKVNTKVSLRIDLRHSHVLTDEEKTLVITKLASRLTHEGVLVITAQDKRSQSQNKDAVIGRLNKILVTVFTPRKSRKATKPTKSSRQCRMNTKKLQAEKKQWRQPPRG